MTQSERDGIRARRDERYRRALVDFKDQCRRLNDYVDTMRDIIRLHDAGNLHAFVLPSGEKRIGIDSDCLEIRLPSHTEMADAILECQQARQERDRLAREQD